MATTSLSLGEQWEVFIKNEVRSGRYGFASEVVRDAAVRLFSDQDLPLPKREIHQPLTTGFTVATRNIKDLEECQIKLINPFTN